MIKNTFLVVAVWLVLLAKVQAVQLPEGFIDEPYVTGLDGQITGFDASAPSRIFISEKAGVIRVVYGGELLDEPFLDINEIVNDRVDRGLLSVAVHPQFPDMPYVYVLYTYDPPELVTNAHVGPGVLEGNGNRVSRLGRYTADVTRNFNVAVTGSELIILGRNSTYDTIGNPEDRFDTLVPSCGPIGNPTEDCLPVDEDSHTIGAMRFAEDGSLYVTNGDGASYRSYVPMTEMSYDLDSLRGKILRIDPLSGKGLTDNPYFDGNPSSNRSRVVSSGLRNPYSLTLHPLSGVPYVGDVGEKLWEEINAGSAKNFGWPCYEGGDDGNLRQTGFEPMSFCQELYDSSDNIQAPVLSWEHAESGSSAMVGDFYYGEAFPAHYTGMLFYADFIQGWMKYADVSDPSTVSEHDFASDMLPMTEVRVGEDGALYYASITTGEIRRIRYEGGGGAVPDTGGEPGDNEPGGSVKVGALSPSFLLLFVLGGLRLRRRQCVGLLLGRKA